ncbi:MAG: sulfur reduction protein DsrS [Gammaproteobacteria bacterium]
MDLSPEDSLRLNVLLTQGLLAVRVDESRMLVYALTERGEAKVNLNPNCRNEQYIRNVKSLLSSHSLGSPGGYPVYLKRWTRMGQARDDSLEQLLLLGEEEAVVAVVHAPGLTNELARRAWWCSPTSDNARRMLEKEEVVRGDMGKILAEHLIEHLPFEEEQQAMIDSVKSALQPGLVTEELRQNLWSKAKSKASYYVGFLQASPDDLPGDAAEHPSLEVIKQKLGPLREADNPIARLLLRVLSANGQNYLNTVEAVLKRPSNQDVVVALFMAIENYFADANPGFDSRRDIEAMIKHALHCAEQPQLVSQPLMDVMELAPELKDKLAAMMLLSGYCEELAFPVFGLSDAIGSVMRKRIEHLTTPLKQQLAILRS